MAAQPKPRLTPEQYLEIERASDTRHEYFNGEMFAMAGASYRHSQIVANFVGISGAALRGKPCSVTCQDIRTRISPEGLYTYPDVVVVCGEPVFADSVQDMIVNPTVIVEVLSPSTEAQERGTKFAQYRQIESLQEYVLVSQGEARVEVFRRQANGQWIYSDFAGKEAMCVLESIECRVALAEIYDKVALDDPDLPTRV